MDRKALEKLRDTLEGKTYVSLNTEQAPLAQGNKYEIHRTLILSTVHIREETSQALFDCDGALEDGENPSVCLAVVYELREYGYLLHVIDDEDSVTPDDLRRNELSDLADIVELARSLGCDWIRLDRDGPTYESLPQYVWAEPDK